MKCLRPCSYICLRALLVVSYLYLPGCLEFESIEQPSSILSNELFSVLVEVAGDGPDWGENWYPIFGICLPMGCTIPGDTVEYSGAYQGSITYDPRLSLELEDISPAPEGYYWWVGRGPWWAVYDPGEVFAEIPIQADLQPGLYSLEYLLSIGPNHNHHKNAERSGRYIIEVVDEWTPRGLNASSQDSSVVLAWLPPLEKEGLAGYNVYRNGELLNAEPFTDSEYSDQDLPGGVFHYSVSSIYENGDQHTISNEIEAIIFSEGTGEANAPYQVTLAEQLVTLADFPELLDKHFMLNNNIDLDPNLQGGRVFNMAVIPRFSGTFDGQGYEIQHLTIEAELNQPGLFGQLESEGEIRDLKITDVNIISSASFVAGLVGANYGELKSCYIMGTITGNSYVGGLAGRNEGKIIASFSTGTVGGDNRVGGLVGANKAGSIIACYSTSTVRGDRAIGGLSGENDGSISNSYSTGEVTGNSSVGGFVGQNNWGMIINCYSVGLVTGDTRTGGFIGADALPGGIYTGFRSHVIGCFWDMQTSGRTTSGGGSGLLTFEIGLLTREMQIMTPYRNAGWDFLGEPENGLHEFWQMPESGGYPELAIFSDYTPPQLQGSGMPEDPYLVNNAAELGAIMYHSRSANYRLAESVNLAGISWSIPVIPSFGGTLDGNDRTISHLTINGQRYAGLFGELSPGAAVSGLGLEDMNVTGAYYVGGLTGLNNHGQITNCYSIGVVDARYEVGGLVGHNAGGSIIESFSAGEVRAGGTVGGLVGYNVGSIASSYSNSSVVGVNFVAGAAGGLVGSNDGGIATSYSSGPVSGRSSVGGLVGSGGDNGTVDTSFWDIWNSGQTASAGGTGMTTGEMWMASTFLSAGWDFIDETANGSEDIWWILEEQDYPRLWWELIPEN